jgi:protein phosphatase
LNIQLEIIARTECGPVRGGNEDTVLVARWAVLFSTPSFVHYEAVNPEDEAILLVVTDGCGDAIPDEVLECFAVALPSLKQAEQIADALSDVVEQANLLACPILRRPENHFWGATLTAAFFQEGEVYFAQVGDTRGYLFRAGKLHPVTTDQTYVEVLRREGKITLKEAETHPLRNVILQSIGTTPHIFPGVTSVALQHNDIILLCSDGLWKLVEDSEIAAALGTSSNLQDMHANLFELLEKKAHHDNASVILARVTGDDLPPPIEDELRFEIVRDVKPYPFPYYPPLDNLPKSK